MAQELVKDARVWSQARVWSIIALIWLANTVSSICCTAFEPALPIIGESLGVDNAPLEDFTITVYLVAFCLGPLIISPLNEIYGRAPLTFGALLLYIASLAVCGSGSSIALFIVFRFLMGAAAVALIICGGAIIADIVPFARRGLAISLLTNAQALGPTLGPLIGGYITQSLNWRWIFWVGIIAMALPLAGLALLLRETYPPILNRRCEKSVTAKDEYTRTEDSRIPPPQNSDALRAAWIRPFRYLLRTRLIPLFAIYSSLVNGFLFILLATLGTTFESVYHFSSGPSGLAYLGMTVGFIAAQASLGFLSDAEVSKRAARRGDQKAAPEDRLPPILIGSVLMPVSLLFYGWTIQQKTAWIAPVVGSGLVAFATMYCYLPVQIYIVDAFTSHTASALGSLTIIRSAAAAAIPVAANPLFTSLGYGIGCTILAGISVPSILFSIALIRYGQRIRASDSAIQ